jgi:outer membrane protein
MRKLILTAAFALLGAWTLQAQKYAYVDTDYILKNIPEYNDAQAILEDLATEWQKEIEDKFAAVDNLYKDYQAEAILLPEDLKKQRENEIIQKEKEAKDLQKKRFGKEGDLYKKRVELIQPIQEKVYTAIEEIANERSYSFVFDKAAGATLLYVQSRYDLSDDVLDQIGAVMQTVKREDRARPAYQGDKQPAEDQGGQQPVRK